MIITSDRLDHLRPEEGGKFRRPVEAKYQPPPNLADVAQQLDERFTWETHARRITGKLADKTEGEQIQVVIADVDHMICFVEIRHYLRAVDSSATLYRKKFFAADLEKGGRVVAMKACARFLIESVEGTTIPMRDVLSSTIGIIRGIAIVGERAYKVEQEAERAKRRESRDARMAERIARAQRQILTAREAAMLPSPPAPADACDVADLEATCTCTFGDLVAPHCSACRRRLGVG